ncbi:MAG: Hpt domain-containing protein [Bacteroidetes bacterium]|nr:Hpt domain-containing protein [Bacteroidota bacterium]
MSIRRYNLSYLHEISGGDEDFILDMVSTFVNNSPLELSEMNSLADEKKWLVLGEHAHKFAPGLQFLGLVSLRPVINQIEDFAFNMKIWTRFLGYWINLSMNAIWYQLN